MVALEYEELEVVEAFGERSEVGEVCYEVVHDGVDGEEEEVCDEVVEGVGDDGAVFSPIFCTFVRLSF